MPIETGIASLMGLENTANKDHADGYPSLDASAYLPANELYYYTLLALAYAESGNVFIDDVPANYNLIFCASGHYIAFDTVEENVTMRKP